MESDSFAPVFAFEEPRGARRVAKALVLACALVGLVVVLGGWRWVSSRRYAPAPTSPSVTLTRQEPAAAEPAADKQPGGPQSALSELLPARDRPPTRLVPVGGTAAAAPDVARVASAATRPTDSVATPRSTEETEADRTLTPAAQRWLDAYYRQNRTDMMSVATGSLKVADERAATERPPAGLEQIERSLDQVTIQFAAATALLTARMIEQASVNGAPTQYFSWISLMWIRDAGQWRLADVRIVSDTKLK